MLGRRWIGGYASFRCQIEAVDQVLIVAIGLGLVRFEFSENAFHLIDGQQDQSDRMARYRHAVTKLAHQGFGSMGQCFKARQAEKTAGAFNRMDKSKDIAQNFCVVRVLFEPDQFIVDGVEALARFRQEFIEKIIHFQLTFLKRTHWLQVG